ncbi:MULTISPECIES: hypothetical protein [Acinetobacter]|uniref:HigA2-like helix-turn-helix domain-containing protein n=1 Tax=Acinetobacter pecorum TaxID=2762215 RepID=A0ABR8VV10_9GAMM|nr:MULTISPECIES: hypothetical protein [Acinetobacter]MBD8008615.1 hypothetical protein [Acinetobacter pecorum]OAL77162.1 hypothetical protein AY607_09050 [Acinetobacter sp. SFA]
MLKMTDVLEQNLVQNFSKALFSSTDLITEQLNQGILNASDAELKHAILHFFNQVDAVEAAQALEIPAERINELQQGIALKDEESLADTLKVVALCLAMETGSLDQVEVYDCLQDYPM